MKHLLKPLTLKNIYFAPDHVLISRNIYTGKSFESGLRNKRVQISYVTCQVTESTLAARKYLQFTT